MRYEKSIINTNCDADPFQELIKDIKVKYVNSVLQNEPNLNF